MKNMLLMSTSLSLSLFLLTPVQAQEAAEQDSFKGFEIEEISVTARKVTENMQDVPVAVTAFTGDALERRQINTTTDIGKITPNLEFTNNAPLAGNPNSSIIFIRGIGQVSPRANSDPGVGLYIDDVYMGQSVGGTMEFRDIAGVQVLRGPQGTLFGRNTIGGAVLLSTKEPGEEFGGTVKTRVGTDNLRQIFAGVDVPITDELKTRFTMGHKSQDGYVTRLYDGTKLGDTNNTTITAKAVYTPSDNFTIKLNFDHTQTDENGAPLVFAAYGNNTDPTVAQSAAFFGAIQSIAAGCTDAYFVGGGGPGAVVSYAPGFDTSIFDSVDFIAWDAGAGAYVKTVGGPPLGYTAENTDSRCANNQWNAGPYANNGTGPVGSSMENWGVSLNMAYDMSDAVTLKSITSYRELNWTGKRDADNTPFTILHTDYDSSGDQFSQELQATYSSDIMKGVVGLFYYEEEVVDILTVALGERESLDSDNNTVQNDAWAAFTQWTYDITDKLSLTGGIRYTEENKGSIPDQFDYADPDAKYLEVKLYEEKYTATTFSGSIDYRFNDNFMVYASYSEGFKGGGWNSSFNVPQSAEALENFHQFDEERAKTIEVGFKSDLLDNTLRLNAAAFFTDYTDLQFVFRAGPAPYLLNAGKASINGFEAELTWVPSENWIIEAGIGYLDDSIDEVVDLSGLGVSTPISTDNSLPFTPEIQANLGIGYTNYIGNLEVSPRVDISYRDQTFFDTANTVEIAQMDGVTTIDASIAVQPQDGNWQLVFSMNNLTDEVYPVSGNSSLTTGSGYAEAAYARKRQWFLSLNYDF
ncbi:TonB-dependent receptor [Emcibacter nanhaiensis]|uniref:TonB-dependent receptor n=2 Tax=Emcibacter nanhaiensis TaxID=1505037 RepID=A0A501PRN9_9PROT|nr:TonB-dependent receptor [Emcibacter nanhaiensis]